MGEGWLWRASGSCWRILSFCCNHGVDLTFLFSGGSLKGGWTKDGGQGRQRACLEKLKARDLEGPRQGTAMGMTRQG